MATLYNVNKTVQGINGYGTPFCDQVYTSTLAANTNTQIAVPLGAVVGMAPATPVHNTFLAVFSYAPGASVWVSVNANATAPVGAPFALSASELNPTAKKVKAGDTLDFLCVAGCSMSIAFYSTQEN